MHFTLNDDLICIHHTLDSPLPVDDTSDLKFSGETPNNSVTACMSKRTKKMRRKAKRKKKGRRVNVSGTGKSRPEEKFELFCGGFRERWG